MLSAAKHLQLLLGISAFKKHPIAGLPVIQA
jgi:hypothetical protein